MIYVIGKSIVLSLKSNIAQKYVVRHFAGCHNWFYKRLCGKTKSESKI